MKKVNRKRRIILLAVIGVFVGIIVACAVYVGDYYHADMAAIELYAANSTVDYETLEDGMIVFAPKEATTGIIFYPGAKVEYTSYLPLMQACAEQGLVCVLVEMPFNIAMFDINAADEIPEKYPQVTDWYIGGHSLGGSMAAMYLADHAQEYEGLLLLGSYSTADLSQTDLAVISIFGSEDKVINWENYESNKQNISANLAEYEIEGGCHAYFGMYGAQEGDGEPTISAKEQIEITAKFIADHVLEKSF